MNILFFACCPKELSYFDINDDDPSRSIRYRQSFNLIQCCAKRIDKEKGVLRCLSKQQTEKFSAIVKIEANQTSDLTLRQMLSCFAKFLEQSGGCLLVENGAVPIHNH